MALSTNLAALPPPEAEASPRPVPLLPERSDFLEGGEAPAAAKVEAFLAQAFAASGNDGPAKALVPWICDALLEAVSEPSAVVVRIDSRATLQV